MLLLVTGYWLLVGGYWLRATGYWLLPPSFLPNTTQNPVLCSCSCSHHIQSSPPSLPESSTFVPWPDCELFLFPANFQELLQHSIFQLNCLRLLSQPIPPFTCYPIGLVESSWHVPRVTRLLSGIWIWKLRFFRVACPFLRTRTGTRTLSTPQNKGIPIPTLSCQRTGPPLPCHIPAAKSIPSKYPLLDRMYVRMSLLLL